MSPDRIYLALATLCFAASFGYAVASLRAGNYRGSWWNFAAMVAGLGFQTAFLGVRGSIHGRCPVTDLGETLVFVSWSMVIIYVLVGRTYRLSLMGVFTAPLVFLSCVLAMVTPFDASSAAEVAAARGGTDWWTEFHIGVSLLAYGAFGMAFVAGLMFLIQERQVRRGTLKILFYNLPPMQNLAVAVLRLLLVGVALMAAGIASAHKIAGGADAHPIWPLYVIWAAYATLVGIKVFRGLAPTSLAKGAMAAFTLALLSLGLISSSG
jgi:ABC-type uncharacterized transport system permease subunit